MPRKHRGDGDDKRILGFLGVGLDGTDEHKRVTRSEHFLLVGGSEETHDRMQDTAIRFQESLDKRGRRLQDTPAREAIDLLREALDR